MHAEQPLGRDRVGPDVVPEHPGLTGVGPQQPDGHRQGGGLAGAVRAEQAVERAGRHVQVDAGDRDLAVEALGQAAQRQRRVLHQSCVDVSAAECQAGVLARATVRGHAVART